MDEQELTEARTLIAEVRAMLKEGTQAVRDLRDLAARFEAQAGPVQVAAASVPEELDARFAALETEVRRTVQRLELQATSAVTALNLRAGGPS